MVWKQNFNVGLFTTQPKHKRTIILHLSRIQLVNTLKQKIMHNFKFYEKSNGTETSLCELVWSFFYLDNIFSLGHPYLAGKQQFTDWNWNLDWCFLLFSFIAGLTEMKISPLWLYRSFPRDKYKQWHGVNVNDDEYTLPAIFLFFVSGIVAANPHRFFVVCFTLLP